jgi:hypothetical protein
MAIGGFGRPVWGGFSHPQANGGGPATLNFLKIFLNFLLFKFLFIY